MGDGHHNYRLTPRSTVDVYKAAADAIGLIVDTSRGGIPVYNLTRYSVDLKERHVDISLSNLTIPTQVLKELRKVWIVSNMI